MRRWGSFRTQLALVAAAGLAVRVLYTLLLARRANGPFARGDIAYYHQVANHIADGRGIINPRAFLETGATIPSAEHPPVWTSVLGLVSELGGRGELAHRLTGALVGAAVIVCIGLLARRAAGDRAGIAAAAIAAVYPVLIAADGSLMSETVYGLVLAGAMLLAYRLLERSTLGRAAALGAAVGAAALSRGEGIFLLVLLALPVAWRTRPGWLPRAAVAVAACALVILPWTLRNEARFGKVVPLSTNDGSTISGANCERTYGGEGMGFWTFECFTPVVYPRNEALQSARWRSDGVRYAGDHADRLPAVVGVRLLRTLGVWHPRRELDFAEGRNRHVEAVGQAAFLLVVLPLAAYGGVLLRRRGAPLFILLAPVASVVITTVTAYGQPRFRHGADITAVVLAGVAVAELSARRSRAVTGREWQPALAATSPRRAPQPR